MLKNLLWLALIYPLVLQARPLQVTSAAESVHVINADNGSILYSKNADKLQYPASIMKMAAGLYALEVKGDQLSSPVTASAQALRTVGRDSKAKSGDTLPGYWLESDAKVIDLKVGETLTLDSLLHAHLIVSACDASNVMAEYCGGTIPQFIEGANNFLGRLGCTHTKMINPHGLFHPKQVTSARDQALIAREALKIPQFREIVRRSSWIRPPTPFHEKIAYRSTNQLLSAGPNFYPFAIGVKTGWTALSKHNLVAAAEKDGRTVVAVLLKSANRPQMFADAKKIFETAFAEKLERRPLLQAGTQRLSRPIEGSDVPITTYTLDPAHLDTYPSESPTVTTAVHWHPVSLPIPKGTEVGRIVFKAWEDKPFMEIPLYAAERLEGTLKFRIQRWISYTWANTLWFEALAASLLSTILLLLWRWKHPATHDQPTRDEDKLLK